MKRGDWIEQQSLRDGWSPQLQPRGTVEATFPLIENVRYRVSLDGGAKGHLLMKGTDHAHCGLTLQFEEDRIVNSGYDQYYWIVEDERKGNGCGTCTRWANRRWRAQPPAPQLPKSSPISAEEWRGIVSPDPAAARRLAAHAALVAVWLGAEIIEEAA